MVDIMKKIIVPEYYGWLKEPELVKEYIKNKNILNWSATEAAKLTFDEIPDYVSGAEIALQVLGKKLPDYDQLSVGSCVGFGTTKAVEYLSLAEILINKDKEKFKTLSQEVTYGLSRVEIGGGLVVGDGSFGIWGAQAVQEYGVIARRKYKEIDLSKYIPKQCRLLGKDGLSKNLEGVAKKHPVKSYVQISNWRDACVALAQGYFILVCSDQGFRAKRDENGFATPFGIWLHCMCISGYQKKTVNNEYRDGCLIDNSFGSTWHNGGLGKIPMNNGAFWVDKDVIDYMLSQGDSFALSSFDGFPKRHVKLSAN